MRPAISVLTCCLVLLLVSPHPARAAGPVYPEYQLPAPAVSTAGNLLLFWTDEQDLKAVTLLSFSRDRPVGIVSIPLFICLDTPQAEVTVADTYYRQGRTELTSRLEQMFRQPIQYYVIIDQSTLSHMSEVVGAIDIGENETTLLDVFEGNYDDRPNSLQAEIRGLAANLLTPSTVVKLPQLIWIYSTEVDSNLGPRHVLGLYRLVKVNGPGVLYKKAIPGVDYQIRDRRLRVVEPHTWTKVLEQVSDFKT
ncbi:MAG: LCP family protein [Bacillota bacterium]